MSREEGSVWSDEDGGMGSDSVAKRASLREGEGFRLGRGRVSSCVFQTSRDGHHADVGGIMERKSEIILRDEHPGRRSGGAVYGWAAKEVWLSWDDMNAQT